MQAFRLDGKILRYAQLCLLLFVGRHVFVAVDADHLRGDVGHDEEIGVVVALCQIIGALFRQFYVAVLFVDRKEQGLVGDVHVFRLLLHVEVFGLLQGHFHPFLAKELDEGPVFRQGPVGAQQRHTAFAFLITGIALCDLFAGIGQVLRGQATLGFEEFFHVGAQGLVLLIFGALRYRTGDDQRRTGVVDEHRVDLVDHGEVVLALHLLVQRAHHVVAQVVETEFVVGSIGDIATIGANAFVGMRFVFIDTVDGQEQELEDGADPFAVAPGQVVVHRHHMHALPREAVQIGRQGGDEGFTLPCCHLGDLAVVEHLAADQLHVVVYHIPGHLAAGCYPGILPDGAVAFDPDIRFARHGGQVAIVLGGGDGQFFVLRKATGGFFYYGKGFGKKLEQYFFEGLVAVVAELIDLFE